MPTDWGDFDDGMLSMEVAIEKPQEPLHRRMDRAAQARMDRLTTEEWNAGQQQRALQYEKRRLEAQRRYDERATHLDAWHGRAWSREVSYERWSPCYAPEGQQCEKGEA